MGNDLPVSPQQGLYTPQRPGSAGSPGPEQRQRRYRAHMPTVEFHHFPRFSLSLAFHLFIRSPVGGQGLAGALTLSPVGNKTREAVPAMHVMAGCSQTQLPAKSPGFLPPLGIFLLRPLPGTDSLGPPNPCLFPTSPRAKEPFFFLLRKHCSLLASTWNVTSVFDFGFRWQLKHGCVYVALYEYSHRQSL